MLFNGLNGGDYERIKVLNVNDGLLNINLKPLFYVQTNNQPDRQFSLKLKSKF